MHVSTIKYAGEISIKAPYEAEFIKQIKGIGGRWGGGEWTVPEDREDQLYVLMKKYFGYDKIDPTLLTIHIAAEHFKTGNKCRLNNIDLVRICQYTGKFLLEDTIIVEGDVFKDDDGNLQFKEDTILETKVPKGFLELLSKKDREYVEVIKEELSRDTLLARKLELENDLRGIEILLEKEKEIRKKREGK